MPDTTPTPVIELKNIEKSFGDNTVLHDVSISAQAGEVVVLLGSSGSGKSTLLRLINGLEQLDAGEIIFKGEPLKTHAKKGRVMGDEKQWRDWRKHIGFVFQNFNLWPQKTVVENIIEAPIQVLKKSKAEALSDAEHLLEQVGLLDHQNKYPLQLSGGQQQRAAIARTLAMKPDLLLFDEPTSALDPELVGEVLAVIKALAKQGNTMLVVTHELGFAREVADKIIFLHEGYIEEQGSSEYMFNEASSERVRKFLSNNLK